MTLFIGDKTRFGLCRLTQEQLAGILSDPLRTKIMDLPDDVIGPKPMAPVVPEKTRARKTVGTIGNQRTRNYAYMKRKWKNEKRFHTDKCETAIRN
jgi:hypothetical protein